MKQNRLAAEVQKVMEEVIRDIEKEQYVRIDWVRQNGSPHNVGAYITNLFTTEAFSTTFDLEQLDQTAKDKIRGWLIGVLVDPETADLNESLK